MNLQLTPSELVKHTADSNFILLFLICPDDEIQYKYIGFRGAYMCLAKFDHLRLRLGVEIDCLKEISFLYISISLKLA